MDRVERNTADRTFALNLGVDERGLRQGAGQNDRSANIGSVKPSLIAQDSMYYKGMPMNQTADDPIIDKNELHRLQTIIRENLELAAGSDAPNDQFKGASQASAASGDNLTASAAPDDTLNASKTPDAVDDATAGSTDIPSTPREIWGLMMTFPQRCVQIAQETRADLRQWNSLPCKSHGERIKYVLQSDNRIYFILALLIFIVMIAAGVRALMKLRKPAA